MRILFWPTEGQGHDPVGNTEELFSFTENNIFP